MSEFGGPATMMDAPVGTSDDRGHGTAHRQPAHWQWSTHGGGCRGAHPAALMPVIPVCHMCPLPPLLPCSGVQNILEVIAHEGFDCRNSNPNGLLGQGAYFAGEGERCRLHAGWAHSAHCTACSKLAGQPPICNHTAHTSPLPPVTAASSSYSSAYSRAPVRALGATNPLPASVPRLAVPPGCHAMFLCRVALGRQALPAKAMCTYACVQPAPVRAACAVALAVALPLAAAEPRCAALRMHIHVGPPQAPRGCAKPLPASSPRRAHQQSGPCTTMTRSESPRACAADVCDVRCNQ